MASSVGSMNAKWLYSFYQSAFPNESPVSEQQFLLSRFRLMYPTLSQVKACHLGLQMAGFLYLKKAVFDKGKTIYKKILSKIHHQNKCLDLNLYHTKIGIFSQQVQIQDDNGSDSKKQKIKITDRTSIYMGSHNFSQAAWGNIDKKGSQLFMMNYELGVVFPPQLGSAAMKNRIINSLPFSIPPRLYDWEVDSPFMQDAL